eukprot:CAMPEP_0197028036 /NCGR_PEP_ID=MMETSP1384-20130603/7841_1 /TAXON_ID=29189 /ORGANISM="Ammonia sp." /LENGTH=230 /DNA_ID=CAMNT_0042456973 /DNA_START=35 /DNA_END=727 /DNA_ORIENTATION=+
MVDKLQVLGLLGISVIALFLINRYLRPHIYNVIAITLTAGFYQQVLDRLDNNATLLDVGIGTGKALVRNKQLIVKKNLKIVGVDYDADYIKQCKEEIKKHHLEKHVSAVCVSIYDYNKSLSTKFDAVYFSSSLMIMPDQVAALTHCTAMLKSRTAGKIYATQTFENKKNGLLETIKPMLKWITTIDFGTITYHKDFMRTVQKAQLRVSEDTELGGQGSARTYRLITLQCE